jgi:hypothetical protein
LRKKQFREELKTFLIELGEKEGYKSYSGYSECLDVRIKRKRIEYKPDVVWNTGKSCYAFEFAFTEDWRADKVRLGECDENNYCILVF